MSDETQQERTQETSQSSEGGGKPNPGASSEAQNAASERPDWLPEQFWDAEAKTPKAEDLARGYSDLAAFKADIDLKQAARPETVDGYKLPSDLPADVKLPDGVNWTFDEKDPRLALGRQVAHAAGMDQVAFEQTILKPFIEFEAGRVKQETDAEAAFVAKQNEVLGPKADDRRAAVKNSIAAAAGAEAAEIFEPMLVGAKVLTALERIFRRSSSGVVGLTAQGRDSSKDDGKIDGWDGMSPAEKMHASRMRSGGGARA